MRIVGGRHRGRRLQAPAGLAVRPTSDRARQALFDILEHGGFGPGGLSPIQDAVVLDAFCGTAALALEALSRGAARAMLIDSSAAALAAAKANAAALGEAERVRLLRRDATRPGAAPEPATLAFLDPPYGQGLAVTALAALAADGWLAADALVCMETGAREAIDLPAGFAPLDARRYGAAVIQILRVTCVSASRNAPGSASGSEQTGPRQT